MAVALSRMAGHAYWRFDFDIDGASSDSVFEYNSYTANNGWGPGWHQKQSEIVRLPAVTPQLGSYGEVGPNLFPFGAW